MQKYICWWYVEKVSGNELYTNLNDIGVRYFAFSTTYNVPANSYKQFTYDVFPSFSSLF